MYVTPEQFLASNKAGVDALIGLASTQFSALERLSTLNFNVTKSAFEDGVSYAKAIVAAKDPQEFVSINASATQPVVEKAIAYSRSVYELATQAQNELTKFIESQAMEFNKSVSSNLDKFAKNAPAGSDVAVAAVKSALAAANSAYDSISRAAKQATDFAEANFSAATSVAKEQKKKAA